MGLDSDMVISLTEDHAGNIWIGSEAGAAFYDVRMDSCIPFRTISDKGTTIVKKVNKLRTSGDGKVWMSVNGQGMFMYDPVTNELKNLFYENGHPTLPVNVRDFIIGPDEEVFISLYNYNLCRVDEEKEEISPVIKGAYADFFKGDDIKTMAFKPSDPNILYLASVKRGLCELNISTGFVRVLIPAVGYSPEDMKVTRDMDIWLTTTNGIYIYSVQTGTYKYINYELHDPFSISDIHILSVLIDRKGGIWIGTNANGLDYSGPFHGAFDKYYSYDQTSLASSYVRSFAEDESRRIWIATEGSGLLTYDRDKRTLSRYDDPRLPDNMFVVQWFDGYLWIGTLKGLYRLDVSSGRLDLYDSFEIVKDMAENKVYALYVTVDGQLLVGTTVGLLIYDDVSDSFHPLPELEWLFATYIDQDSNGNVWMSTYSNGLICYDMRTRKIKRRYNQNSDDGLALPSNKFLSIHLDRDDIVWATTYSDGFCRIDYRKDSLMVFDQKTCLNLPSDIYYNVIEDDNGMMWFASGHGLLCMNRSTFYIRKFTVSDGLLADSFKNCSLMTDEGDIYLGSKGGFIRFNPNEVLVNVPSSNLVVSEFLLDNEIVIPGEGSPLSENIMNLKAVHLSPRQNSFGFGFSVLGSSALGTGTVLCKLEGYDNGWREVESNNTVSYYNVPAGTYTLKTMLLGGSGMSDEYKECLTVTVGQKFYKSAVAIILYVVLLITLFVLTFMLFYRKALKKERLAREEYRREKEEELFQDKMNFFSNIMHELKTPLTLIRTPLRNIMASGKIDESLEDDIAVINNSAEYMDQLVKELLDFVRIEKHGYVLDIKSLDIVEKIEFFCFNFSETARNRNLKLTFRHDREHVMVNLDEGAINKIINNIIHNAVKYAETYIDINLREEEDIIVVSFTNDGPVIPREKREDIFKPFVQYSNDRQPYSQSFGIGLALSKTLTELHNGTLELADDEEKTVFVLIFPRESEQSGVESSCHEAEVYRDDGKPVVLLVEDNDDLSSYLQRKLGNDYYIISVSSAERALARLRQTNVDIILSDIALGRMSGIELCAKVTEDYELSHIPVIIISGIASVETKIKCMESGASLYLEKPFSLDYLKACMNGLLEKGAAIKKVVSIVHKEVDTEEYNIPDADNYFLERLNEVVTRNLGNPSFSNSQIEQELFISRSTLIRKVKTLLDTTPNDYIRSKRMAVAAKLLEEGNVRVNEVCFKVGFNSSSYFAKCFREFYGMLPAEYKKKFSKNNTKISTEE
ncbi:MAG: two-component regulator propeller domain-containing protein [Candidatus Cryptobacteroides sp.]